MMDGSMSYVVQSESGVLTLSPENNGIHIRHIRRGEVLADVEELEDHQIRPFPVENLQQAFLQKGLDLTGSCLNKEGAESLEELLMEYANRFSTGRDASRRK